jgi:Fe-S cluster assembly scaffold protein SufB
MANQIISQVSQTNSLITSALNIHLNIGQNLTMNTPSVFMSLETASIESLANKLIQQVGNAQLRIPSRFYLSTNSSSSISVRVRC